MVRILLYPSRLSLHASPSYLFSPRLDKRVVRASGSVTDVCQLILSFPDPLSIPYPPNEHATWSLCSVNSNRAQPRSVGRRNRSISSSKRKLADQKCLQIFIYEFHLCDHTRTYDESVFSFCEKLLCHVSIATRGIEVCPTPRQNGPRQLKTDQDLHYTKSL